MTIDRIKERVELIKKAFQRDGSSLNEASISRQVVEPILRDLEWPTDDTEVVKYEHPLKGGRADIALFHEGKPIVIVEVKRPGSAEGTEEQLFQYTYHAGVSLAVLTTGEEWEVYLPMKPGDYQDRQVYKLDISARETEESASRLKRYLFYPDLCSGKAKKNAEADHGDKTRVKKIQEALPKAWGKVLLECDDSLVRLLQDKVGDICGYNPDADVVKAFIGGQSGAPLPSPRPPPSGGRKKSAPKPTGRQLGGFELGGESYPASSGRETLIKFCEAMAKRDSKLPEQFALKALIPSWKVRPWIVRERADLYPTKPKRTAKHSHKLPTGHWVGTYYITENIEKIIETACGVAGINFGKELKLLYK